MVVAQKFIQQVWNVQGKTAWKQTTKAKSVDDDKHLGRNIFPSKISIVSGGCYSFFFSSVCCPRHRFDRCCWRRENEAILWLLSGRFMDSLEVVSCYWAACNYAFNYTFHTFSSSPWLSVRQQMDPINYSGWNSLSWLSSLIFGVSHKSQSFRQWNRKKLQKTPLLFEGETNHAIWRKSKCDEDKVS